MGLDLDCSTDDYINNYLPTYVGFIFGRLDMINLLILLLISDRIELHDTSGLLHYRSHHEQVELKNLKNGLYRMSIIKDQEIIKELNILI